ncbi:response regulator [Halonotius terrestris]|uniref:histidine kinase n=1 Tax=Halonotius terrestris TaxID=2487750 RepID=A0A8J8P9G0_9EURY|nr:ATP-binding protein [Halonotius terrestris]TQQ83503.1 response regulator [Halonotius terrestris]
MSTLRVLHLGAPESLDPLAEAAETLTAERTFSIVSVETAAEAHEAYESQPFECLVVEPHAAVDVIDFIASIHETDPKLPILLFTHPDSVDLIGKALAAGATDYVPKTDAGTDYELLATRIETSISYAGEQNTADPWRQSTSAISQLYAVTNQSELSFEEKLDRALEVGAAELGYPVAYATRVEDRNLEILSVAGDHEGIEIGMTSELSENYCKLVVDNAEPVGINNAEAHDALAELSTYSELGLQCYVGAPIMLEDEVFGSLCFAGTEPRDPQLIEAQKLTVKTLAQWVGYELERSRREEELRRQIDRLEEFTNVVSHDLRNPLNVAQGRLELAQAECDSSHLETVVDAMDRMEDIIEDTLTLAREGQTVDDKEPVEIAELLDNCWDVIESEDAELRVVDEFTVHGDRNRLSHIFENLFRNAIEHSTPPVTIRVGLLNVMYTSTRADTGGTFGFFVEDDGPGVPEGRRESVFDAGETTRKDGTGFGLSIVKQIAEAHGWEVELTESFDGGARFEFTNVR